MSTAQPGLPDLQSPRFRELVDSFNDVLQVARGLECFVSLWVERAEDMFRSSVDPDVMLHHANDVLEIVTSSFTQHLSEYSLLILETD